ncbi:MAG: N-terminal phage integrase SAM-like domain-containing protein, partial [Actinomycetota bacterium]|nr:N-terminal phage integrase SAM-like domain-containing protein [Actinomycetota bacterium]
MSKAKASADTRRHKTRYRGISYRERRDGSRTYSVYWRGAYLAVEGGEQEALAKQAELRGKAARGEQTRFSTKLTFADAAEQWLESKRHLRPWTKKSYRAALDNVLLPRFGSMKIGGDQRRARRGAD